MPAPQDEDGHGVGVIGQVRAEVFRRRSGRNPCANVTPDRVVGQVGLRHVQEVGEPAADQGARDVAAPSVAGHAQRRMMIPAAGVVTRMSPSVPERAGASRAIDVPLTTMMFAASTADRDGQPATSPVSAIVTAVPLSAGPQSGGRRRPSATWAEKRAGDEQVRPLWQ